MTATAAATERTVEVADGVHAYLQEPGGWCVSNAGIVVGDDGAVVIDTLATERRAALLRTTVDELCPASRRIVVNTHHHGDHIFGNHLYGPEATIVAHDGARAEMRETGLALTRLWPDVEWGDVRVTLPTVTFTDRLALTVGGRRIELIGVAPAHTTNDVVAWIPDDRVLFAGDVALAGSTPFTLMGSISGSIVAVERLRRIGPRTIVCGHGPVAGPEVLDETIEYLRWIQRLADAGVRKGRTPLEVARDADGRFSHLLDPERIVGNLHRAYAEIEGGPPARPLDVIGIFGEMVEFNEGRLPTCLA
ncbi:MBL fold metallo-hydrolase [Pseudonocardia sp. DSM 110487]|uniref:MBL fold metallo-hydrolase n=1 Tax=Pseudonocardia sp. DSM 110487 TaxID=2865833 RepID=UPI001C69F469|nr:MBL fold metallo-hydrolase [Pseudonocardia sp. DSM 110487]QYN34079.1 MBL fold metallo-hydrolase [Pseudonocardia sp. DSM 110487]